MTIIYTVLKRAQSQGRSNQFINGDRMKQRFVYYLKYNKVIYLIYYYVMSACINVMKLFIKPDNYLILFNSYAGRKYDDSPKAIFESMKIDPRFRNYKIIWAFHQPDKFEVKGAEKIKTDGFTYFKTALKARVWITNSSVERGLNFKGKNTFYLNTGHGSPIKKAGSDLSIDNKSFKSRSSNIADVMNTQSYFEANIFTKCFGIPSNHLIEVGLPRNDELAKYTAEQCLAIRKKLNIPKNKKILLYCPTFREYQKDKNFGVVLAPPINLKKWEKQLGDKYVLLFRAHYEVSNVMEIIENSFVRNITDYPFLNDLMIVSDILISDYSSIFFDYSIMDKCMIHFTYDFEEYKEKRGMYFDIRQFINGADNEDAVINILKQLDYDIEIERTKIFRTKYMNFYGNAAKQTVDYIAKRIM